MIAAIKQWGETEASPDWYQVWKTTSEYLAVVRKESPGPWFWKDIENAERWVNKANYTAANAIRYWRRFDARFTEALRGEASYNRYRDGRSD